MNIIVFLENIYIFKGVWKKGLVIIMYFEKLDEYIYFLGMVFELRDLKEMVVLSSKFGKF